MTNTKEIQKLLEGMAAIVGILERKTAGDPYFGAVVERFTTDLVFAGKGLEWMYRADADTEEFEPLAFENMADTKEFPAVTLYDANGVEVAS